MPSFTYKPINPKRTAFKSLYPLNNSWESKVYDKLQGKEVKANIIRVYGEEYKHLDLWVNDTKVGTTTYTISYQNNGGWEVVPINDLDYYRYGDVKSALELLYISNMQQERFKNVGTELIKQIVKESYRLNLDGHVVLYAKKVKSKEPVPFYYKLGFRSNDYTNRLIEDRMRRGILEFRGSTPMYLPDETRIKYLKELGLF